MRLTIDEQLKNRELYTYKLNTIFVQLCELYYGATKWSDV